MDPYSYAGSNGNYTNYQVNPGHQSAVILQNSNEEIDQLNRQERKYETSALILAVFSVVSLLILGGVSFYISELTNSAAAYGFGFDCLLDIGTSLVVIWRFCGSNDSQSNRKERIALILLGSLFIVAGTSVAVKAIRYLLTGTLMETSVGLYLLSGSATVVSLALFISKLYVANKLDSKSVRADAYSSLACGVTAFTIIVSSVVFTMDPDVFYLDDIVGIVLAVILILYGVKIITDVWLQQCKVNEQATMLTEVSKQTADYQSMY